MYMKSKYHNVKFTCKKESYYSFPFLGVPVFMSDNKFLNQFTLIYKFSCGRHNTAYYSETCHYLKVSVGKHFGFSLLTRKKLKS